MGKTVASNTQIYPNKAIDLHTSGVCSLGQGLGSSCTALAPELASASPGATCQDPPSTLTWAIWPLIGDI